jgi:3-oxoadipate enol-lactonase
MATEVTGLCEDRPVIVYDARGHARSTRPESYTIDDHAADAIGVADALGLQQFALLGVSMGSYVAPRAAYDAADQVRALVLVVPKGHGEQSSTARLMAERPELFEGKNAEELADVLGELMLSPQATPDVRAAVAERLDALKRRDLLLSPEEFARANQALAGFDNRGRFGYLDCPTLVISARDDVLNPPEEGAQVAAAIPGARFEVVERAGHLLTLERPEEYVALLRAFL